MLFSFSSTSFCTCDFTFCIALFASFIALLFISSSSNLLFFLNTSIPVEYRSSYPEANTLSNPNTSESSLLYATYSNSISSLEFNILPVTEHDDNVLISDCALVYNSENALEDISSS